MKYFSIYNELHAFRYAKSRTFGKSSVCVLIFKYWLNFFFARRGIVFFLEKKKHSNSTNLNVALGSLRFF